MVYNKKYDWLFDDIERLKEKINYRNRVEYRISGKIHNSTGPAIIEKFDPLTLIPPSKDYERFFINGDEITFDEWLIYNRRHKIKKIKKLTEKKRKLSN